MINVVKIGGGVLENSDSTRAFLDAFARIEGPKVLIHGGGRLATTMAERLGIPTQMVEGRRITDAQTLQVVTMVYGGLVNKQVVAQLQARGINAMGITGADMNFMLAKKRPLKNGIDYGFVGDVVATQGKMLLQLLEQGITPIVAPLTHDGQGTLLNTNADTMAAETAKALAQSAHHEVALTFCFEKPGVLANPEDDKSVIGDITPDSYICLKQDGVVSGGMLPKLDNAFSSIEAGVVQVRITSISDLQGGTLIHK